MCPDAHLGDICDQLSHSIAWIAALGSGGFKSAQSSIPL